MMTPYMMLAERLGWKYSFAHDGYINENRRNRRDEDRNGWGSYEVASSCEEACFWEGFETEKQVADEYNRLTDKRVSS